LELEPACAALARELAARRYRPGAPRALRISDPKPRLISVLPFRDRVVQHALMAALGPRIERTLAPQSYACRLGKGTHRCLGRAADFTRTRRFALRLDVARFFPSVDHAILRAQLRRVAPEPDLAWLIDVILAAPGHVEAVRHYFPGDDLFAPLRPHGLPIGNLTSQIWANLYLSPLDHLLGDRLGIGAFVRYSDDVLAFDDDKARLCAALDHARACADRLRLRLHPSKTRLVRTTDDVAFLGFVLRRRGNAVRVRLRGENVRAFRRRMRRVRAELAAGALDVDDVTARVRAWLAHAAHGHTRALCEKMLREIRF
jgi:retron-type reverse transcriptase